MKQALLIAILLGSAAPLRAAGFAAGLRTWFEHVKEGLRESSVSGQRQHVRVTAVAAVRGAEQQSADPLKPVWKSASAAKRSRALRAERKELAAAVDSALAGNLDEAQAKLDAFEKDHAASPLLADAREIRAKLGEARAAPAE